MGGDGGGEGGDMGGFFGGGEFGGDTGGALTGDATIGGDTSGLGGFLGAGDAFGSGSSMGSGDFGSGASSGDALTGDFSSFFGDTGTGASNSPVSPLSPDFSLSDAFTGLDGGFEGLGPGLLGYGYFSDGGQSGSGFGSSDQGDSFLGKLGKGALNSLLGALLGKAGAPPGTLGMAKGVGDSLSGNNRGMSDAFIGMAKGAALSGLGPAGALLGLGLSQMGPGDFGASSLSSLGFSPGEIGGTSQGNVASSGGSGMGDGSGLMGGLGGMLGGMNVGDVGAGLASMYMGNQGAKAAQGPLNNLNSLFAPNSPYAQMMREQMERKDAAAGRRSQYGPREAQLAAMLSQEQARTLTSPGYGNLMQQQQTSKNQPLLTAIGLLQKSGALKNVSLKDLFNSSSAGNVQGNVPSSLQGASLGDFFNGSAGGGTAPLTDNYDWANGSFGGGGSPSFMDSGSNYDWGG